MMIFHYLINAGTSLYYDDTLLCIVYNDTLYGNFSLYGAGTNPENFQMGRGRKSRGC